MLVPSLFLVVGMILVLVARQMARSAPLLPIDLLRIPLFALSVATSVCAFVAQAMALVSLPFLFENTLGFNAVETGLLLTPWPLTVAVIAPDLRPPGGPLSGRHPQRLRVGGDWPGGLLLLAFLPAHPDAGGHRLAHDHLRPGFRLLQHAEQPRDPDHGAACRAPAGPAACRRRRGCWGRPLGAALVALVFGVFPVTGTDEQYAVRGGGVGDGGGRELLPPVGRGSRRERG